MAEEITTSQEDVEGSEETTGKEGTEDTTTDSDKDYEAELKAEKDRADAAEAKLNETRQKAKEGWKKRQAKDESEEDGDEEEEDKPLTAKQLERVLAEERERTKKELLSGAISEKARKLAGSDAEANLIIELHKNRSFPAGMPLDEQLEEVQAIANRKRMKAENEELRRALRGKEGVTDVAADAHRDPQQGTEPKMSSQDITAIKAAGYEWDGKSRFYVKKLNGGKKLIYDPRTKQRKVI